MMPKTWVNLWAKYPHDAIVAMRAARVEMRSPSWIQRMKGGSPDLRMYLVKSLRAIEHAQRRKCLSAGGLRMEM